MAELLAAFRMGKESQVAKCPAAVNKEVLRSARSVT
jgi:hypothetical protein